MGERCALCGAADVWKRVGLPEDWERYLADERGLAPAGGYYLLPSCERCHDRVSVNKQLSDVTDGLDGDVPEMLDELTLDALVDEAG